MGFLFMKMSMYGYVAYNAQIGDSYAVKDSSVALLSQNDKKRNPVMLSASNLRSVSSEQL